MRVDVAVVGGGTAGCVVAARLSEDPDRHVCLIEAGPDYGARSSGAWPADLLDPRSLTFTHDWGTGGEDERSLGARVIGGCSTHNACMAVIGTPDDYDEWGPGWGHSDLAPYLRRARETLRVRPANTEEPAPLHVAFLEAARDAGFSALADPDDPSQPVGVSSLPANVVDATRWNTAFAYLDAARGRPNLVVRPDTPVDRLALDGLRATGVHTAAGERIDADNGRARGRRLLHPDDPDAERRGARAGAGATRHPDRGNPARRRAAARPSRHGSPMGADRAPLAIDGRARPAHRAAVRAARGWSRRRAAAAHQAAGTSTCSPGWTREPHRARTRRASPCST